MGEKKGGREKTEKKKEKRREEKKERISNGHAMDTRYKHTKKSTKRTQTLQKKNTYLKTISKF